MGRYSRIKWENQEIENGAIIQHGTPIPPEIIEYYIAHGYGLKGIPLNADTCREIAELI